MRHRGFTLIVVAIIAILAAIAVPNFLEAQVRAKVSRAKADMRSIATGLETYRIDWNAYPYSFVDEPFAPSFDFSNLYLTWWPSLTTPVSYITFRPVDPFGGDRAAINDGMDLRLLYDYRRTYPDEVGGEFTIQEIATGFGIGVDEEPGTSWLLYSPGPDREQNINTMIPSGGFGTPMDEWPFYDPTNGSISVGDIVRAPEGDETTLASR